MREGETPNQGPNISPSNTGAGLPLGETLRRRISSANPPPSNQDKLLANAEIPDVTTQLADFLNKQRRREIRVITATALISSALTGGAIFAANKVFADEPISEPTPATEDIGSVPGGTSFTDDRLVPRTETKQVNPEEVFDNSADKQIVKVGVNARPISQNEALALVKENPPQLHEGDFPTLPLIFIGKLTNGGEAIIETDYVDQAYNPIAQKPDRINSGKEITFTKAGTEIAVTLEEFEVFQIDPFVYKGAPYFAGVVLRFNDPDGVQYRMSIRAPEDIRHLGPTEIIKNAPTVGENGNLGSKDYEKIKDQRGLVIQGGIPILKTTVDNTKVRVGGGPILPEYPKGLPAKILFITQDNQIVLPQ